MENTLLYTALEAAVQAGNIIMEIYEKEVLDVEIKKDDSPVTIADKKANAKIEKMLKVTGIPMITEEGTHSKYTVRKHWKQCWLVDPLDGTKEFIKKNGEFTVNIALIEDGKPIFGVIYIPVLKELYYTNIDATEAYKITLDSHELNKNTLEKAEVLQPKFNTEKIIITSSRSHINEKTKEMIAVMKNADREVEVIKAGSSLKFCLIAEGKASLYPRYAPTMEWDTAAGHAICKAVGMNVYSLETDKPLHYNKENLLNPWFVVRKISN